MSLQIIQLQYLQWKILLTKMIDLFWSIITYREYWICYFRHCNLWIVWGTLPDSSLYCSPIPLHSSTGNIVTYCIYWNTVSMTCIHLNYLTVDLDQLLLSTFHLLFICLEYRFYFMFFHRSKCYFNLILVFFMYLFVTLPLVFPQYKVIYWFVCVDWGQCLIV